MKSLIKTAADHHWQDRLHALKLRATPARLAILQALEKAARPLTVQSLTEKLKTSLLDQATFYRTLHTLQHHGLVRQIEWHHGHAHFELTALGDHHHVVCINCRAVADVSCTTSAKTVRQVLHESGFAAITEHSIEFFGLCQKCQN